MKIILDNGHGVDTPGKRSPDRKLHEYAWNRLIAGRIVAALTDLGHDAQLLVPEQEDISLSEPSTASRASARPSAPAPSSSSPSTPTSPAVTTASTMLPVGAPTLRRRH